MVICNICGQTSFILTDGEPCLRKFDDYKQTCVGIMKTETNEPNETCSSCGGPKGVTTARTLCQSCADKLKDFAAMDRDKRKAKGICRQCPEPLSFKSTVFCEVHLKQHSEQSKLRQRNRPCKQCGGVRDLRRSSLCSKCKNA